MLMPIAAARGQAPGISGTVRDEAGVPVPQVEVLLDLDRHPSRSARTDDDGRYVFRDVGRGIHKLRFQHIGYYPQDLGSIVGNRSSRLDVVMRRLPSSLDTVRVHGVRVGVIGLVVAHLSQRPVDSATVEVLRTHARATTGKNGQFALTDGVDAGPQVVLAKADRYETRMLSVTVPESSTVEVAMMMDPSTGKGANRRAIALADFEDRSHWFGNRSTLMTRAQLKETGQSNLHDAVYFSALLRSKMLNTPGCVIINGGSGAALTDISVDQVEAIEVYGPGSDYTGSLAMAGCSDSWIFAPIKKDPKVVAPRANRQGKVTMVIWLKR